MRRHRSAADPRWRHAQRRIEHITPGDLPWRGEPVEPDSLNARRWKWLRRELRRSVHPHDRYALELHYLSGVNYARLGRRLGVHPTTVQRRIARTIVLLRKAARAEPALWAREGGRKDEGGRMKDEFGGGAA